MANIKYSQFWRLKAFTWNMKTVWKYLKYLINITFYKPIIKEKFTSKIPYSESLKNL